MLKESVDVTHGQPNNVKASWLSFAVLTSDFSKSTFQSYMVFAPNSVLKKSSKKHYLISLALG